MHSFAGCRDRDPSSSSDVPAWGLIALISLSILLLEWRQPLPVALDSTGPFLTACAPLALAAIFYSYFRPRENLALMSRALLQVMLFSALGCVLQYLLAREGGAMWDERLAGLDRTLGLDWLGYIRWVDAHPSIARMLSWAYAAMIPELIAALLILGLSRQHDALRMTILAGMLCGTITIALSPLFPSVSSYVFLGIKQAEFGNLSVVPGYLQFADLDALRKGSLHVIRLPELQGIIAFPSYHAGLATVNAWGFRNASNFWLRSGGLIAAAATIASAPVHGGHYFVDIIAGVAIASCCIVAAKRLAYLRVPRRPLRAWPFRRSREAFAP